MKIVHDKNKIKTYWRLVHLYFQITNLCYYALITDHQTLVTCIKTTWQGFGGVAWGSYQTCVSQSFLISTKVGKKMNFKFLSNILFQILWKLSHKYLTEIKWKTVECRSKSKRWCILPSSNWSTSILGELNISKFFTNPVFLMLEGRANPKWFRLG